MKKIFNLGILLSLIIFFLSSSVFAVSLSTVTSTINLGSYSPGESKYWQPQEGIEVTCDMTGIIQNWTLTIKNFNGITTPNNKGLILEPNPQFYIECSQGNQRFVYHANKNWSNSTGYLDQAQGPLIPNTVYTVYRGVPNEQAKIGFWFDLKVPFKINDQPAPLGRYSTTLVFSLIY